jgi:hypothetical protein
MLTSWTFSRATQHGFRRGATKTTLLSSHFARSREGIEWSCQDTTPWNRTLIWMKDVHRCLRITSGPRTAEQYYLTYAHAIWFVLPFSQYFSCTYHGRFGMFSFWDTQLPKVHQLPRIRKTMVAQMYSLGNTLHLVRYCVRVLKTFIVSFWN